MCKEHLDKMQPNKNMHLDIVLKIIQKILIVAIVLLTVVLAARMLYRGIQFKKNIDMITTYELIEPDTKEKANYITDVFHIKNTNNIGSYKVLFKEGCMTVIMNDVKDIHELCFENLAYYELTKQDYNEIVSTEEEYNEIVDTSLDEHDHSYFKTPEIGFDGRWYSSCIYISSSYNYWEMQFDHKSENYSVFISKTDDGICCKIRTDWGNLEDLDKLHSME